MVTQDNNLPSAQPEGMKHQYEGEMEQKLKELGKKIDVMLEKADASTEQSVKSLKQKKAEADATLQTMKATGQEAWSELKHGMDRAWDDLQTAWMELRNASEKALAKFHK